MNLENDFVQVSKLSEEQKKIILHQKWNNFFLRIQVEDQKQKKSSPKMEHFFPRNQVETCAQTHNKVKLLEGMQMKTILKLLGGIQSNYWGDISPIPPGFRHPWGVGYLRFYCKNYHHHHHIYLFTK